MNISAKQVVFIGFIKEWFSYAADLPGTYTVAASMAWDNAAAYVNIYLSQALTAGLPAKLNSAQLRRQAGGQYLGEVMCRR